MFLCRGMEEPMKKNITKKAAVFLLSTIVAAQSGLSVQAAALTEGSWEQTSAGWKFLNRDRQPYTGWIHTASGWYYLNMEDGQIWRSRTKESLFLLYCQRSALLKGN